MYFIVEGEKKTEIYLGKSPLHARNVALVLNLDTVRVIPQFHLYFDQVFHTFKQEDFDSLWTLKSGLMKQIVQIGRKTGRI